jgi:hypothetical protein
MRFAHVFPTIDNTTTPLGYPLAIKFFTFFGFDEFWGSKIVGISAFFFILFFTWKKKFSLENPLFYVLYSAFSPFSHTL